MTKELLISAGIIVVGVIAAVGYWYDFKIPTFEESNNADKAVTETIILPENAAHIYQKIPEVQQYLKELEQLMDVGQAVVPLQADELDAGAAQAQQIVLNDSEFLADTLQGAQLLHNDIMTVRETIVSALDNAYQQRCQQHSCYQTEKYNFVTNTTTRAIVDIEDSVVLAVERYPNMQPDISVRLMHIAQQIALNAPEVKQELTFTPSVKDMSMANVRAALKESPCENSAHLCVAPVFADHQNQRALWAVVDLTDLKLAGAKWAGLGKTTTPACIAERSLQNRVLMEQYCQQDTELEKNGWQLKYRLTGSDGLEIRDAYFHGKPVLRSAKIVDWHVSYQQEKGVKLDTSVESYLQGRRVEFSKDDNENYFFGYNDAMGCPMFSTSAVLPFNGPQIDVINADQAEIAGFSITQDFRNPKWPMACNYRYENRFEFYDDGSFRIVAVNKGRGCGNNALYRPLMRIDMGFAEQETFYQFDQGQWTVWQQEQQYRLPDGGQHGGQQFDFKLVSEADPESGYYIEPDRGQFEAGQRGDHAIVYVTRFKPDEGDRDLLTLGSCCNLEEDGVERYLTPPESITATNLVIWYVPRIQNDTRAGQEYCWADTVVGRYGNLEVQEWPCSVGPRFVPIQITHMQ
ncbi:MAG: hypothetical protein K0U68_08470 [Gammaproteobacteria bacterium]|nr:hypothetical protein [Gammaproteobacteria bacterium]